VTKSGEFSGVTTREEFSSRIGTASTPRRLFDLGTSYGSCAGQLCSSASGVLGTEATAGGQRCGVGVPPDLHVLAQLLGSDRAALVQQLEHLVEEERVALQRSGVVGFLVPEVVPHVFGLGGAREAAGAGVEILDFSGCGHPMSIWSGAVRIGVRARQRVGLKLGRT
jgi:hypothetical protein